MSLELSDEEVLCLKYFLTRSILMDTDNTCTNPLGEEAACGNEYAIRAIEVRNKIIRTLESQKERRGMVAGLKIKMIKCLNGILKNCLDNLRARR